MSMRKSRRRERIMSLVMERGGMSVGALADRLGVSTQTIRRDIDELCDGQTLRRFHGRVELAEDRLNTPFDQRAGTNLVGKRAIGEAAARLIPDGASVFISIGSTPLAVARALRPRKELTVITNNLSAAMVLSEEVSNRIILPGGEVRLPDRDILGEEVLDFFGRYRTEYGIFGVAGVAEDGGLLEFHRAEVRIAERICENAQTSVLVIDATKFGRRAPVLGGNVQDVDVVVLDRRPAPEFAPLLERMYDKLIYAEGER